MQQHELRPPAGAKRPRKRVGRGNASGHGTYSTRGLKGQKARSGGGVRPGFEGGQLPLVRRMGRKRGFTNKFRVDYEEVNVGALARFPAGTEVTVDALRDARLVRTNRPVKILGEGDLSVALTVEATRFSKSARSKIEAAGGSVRWLEGEPPVEESVEPAAAAPVEAPPDTQEEAEAPKPKRQRAPKAKAEENAEKQDSEGPTGGREEAEDGAGS